VRYAGAPVPGESRLKRLDRPLVTHGVDEAVYLGDRVLGPRPWQIRRIIDIKLERSRDDRAPLLGESKRIVLDEIRDDMPRAACGA